MITHPQVKANETIVEYDHSSAGRIRQARPPAQFSETPAEVRFGAPSLGQHTDEILMEAGFDEGSIAVLRASGILAT